jgi:hypothetical protein
MAMKERFPVSDNVGLPYHAEARDFHPLSVIGQVIIVTIIDLDTAVNPVRGGYALRLPEKGESHASEEQEADVFRQPIC